MSNQFFVPTDIGGHEHVALGHGFERLERRDQFGQPHRVPRVRQHVDQIVIAIDFGMRHAARKDNLRAHA